MTQRTYQILRRGERTNSPLQQKDTQLLPKRDRSISTTEETTNALAKSHVPHPFDAADPPAAVRAGSDGNMSVVYNLRFLSY
jgi:hypothetical protein